MELPPGYFNTESYDDDDVIKRLDLGMYFILHAV